jgi:hypothetical protein
MKFKIILLWLFIFLAFTQHVSAAGNAQVSIVNPVRGDEFWDQKNQKIEDAVIGESQVLEQHNLSATWLLRFDALQNPQIQSLLKGARVSDEKGLFLEITPKLCQAAGVSYNTSSSWHMAESVLLTGYSPEDRKKLIDKAFSEFKQTFGEAPKSVGAWWIDAESLSYMQQKYGVTSSLDVSDQYSTDNYQIWGQYWSTPFYPDKKDALHPAQSETSKIPVVVMQWAARDPVNGYGKGVEESTYSVQANDYIDYHNLGIQYFQSLINTYINQPHNPSPHLVVGLENSYNWSKYKSEYEKQVDYLAQKQKSGEIRVVTMASYAKWYKDTFPKLSPPVLISADDPLGSTKHTIWFMNQYFRVGMFFSNDGVAIVDLRQYIEGDEEPCLQKKCQAINFATFATRVLDQVTYSKQWLLDVGAAKNISLTKSGEDYKITYTSAAGKNRTVTFLPRDIGVDDKISSIDGAILSATKASDDTQKVIDNNFRGDIKENIASKVKDTLIFTIFMMLLSCTGLWLVYYLPLHPVIKLFIGTVVGTVLFTVASFFFGLIHIQFLALFVPFAGLVSIFKWRRSLKNLHTHFSQHSILLGTLIVIGTIFQVIPTIKSGMLYDFGVGYWGPNTHDGIWHVSLVNQLIKSIPPENPIFSQTTLYNYHYLYDILIAQTHMITGISVVDLVFRFFPILFSLLLGILSLGLLKLYSNSKTAHLVGVFLIYFSGSLGWIVEMIKHQGWGGESDFWANQSISFNLNPPFALSMIIVLTIFILLLQKNRQRMGIVVLAVLIGSLLGFKAYAGVLMMASVGVISLVYLLRRDYSLLVVSILAAMVMGLLVVPIYDFSQGSGGLFIWSPFWFIHSMVDSPDRIGWERLSLARMASTEQHQIFKLLAAETIGFLLFVIGNLGIRLLGGAYLFKKTLHPVMLLFCILSFIIPLLFIQSGTPWNTIQFFYYFLYLSSILTSVVIGRTHNKIIFAILLLLVLLSPINSIATASGYLIRRPHGYISNQELAGLSFLQNQSLGIVLTYPYDKNLKAKLSEPWPVVIYDTTAYVSAYTQKPTFLEDEIQISILNTNQASQDEYQKRMSEEREFFNTRDKDWIRNFISSRQITYIYLPKIYDRVLDEQLYSVKKVFENDQVLIYKAQ